MQPQVELISSILKKRKFLRDEKLGDVNLCVMDGNGINLKNIAQYHHLKHNNCMNDPVRHKKQKNKIVKIDLWQHFYE